MTRVRDVLKRSHISKNHLIKIEGNMSIRQFLKLDSLRSVKRTDAQVDHVRSPMVVHQIGQDEPERRVEKMTVPAIAIEATTPGLFAKRAHLIVAVDPSLRSGVQGSRQHQRTLQLDVSRLVENLETLLE